MNKIIVVGAGASGIIASLLLSQTNEVILVDGNNEIGKKILVTGNGRCNYWHDDISEANYATDDEANLKEILSMQDKTLAYLERLGFYPRIKDGYYYPYANSAHSVRDLLAERLKASKVKFVGNFKARDVIYNDHKFMVKSKDKEIVGDEVVIASGLKADPLTGSDGSLLPIIKKYHLTINEVLPALVPLISDDEMTKKWFNVRCQAKVALRVNGSLIKEETGEIQLTKKGISGICVFNLSGRAIRELNAQQDVRVVINFLPTISDINEFMKERIKKLKTAKISLLLKSILDERLLEALLDKANIKSNDYDRLSLEQKELLGTLLTKYEVKIVDYEGYDKAQVCSGGVSLKEINPKTMEVLKVPHLYMIGEVLDGDGICGGYNLAWAFITGYIMGNKHD